MKKINAIKQEIGILKYQFQNAKSLMESTALGITIAGLKEDLKRLQNETQNTN